MPIDRIEDQIAKEATAHRRMRSVSDGAFHRSLAYAVKQAIEEARKDALEEAARLVLRYAVNLSGGGKAKPLHEDGRGLDDVVRTSYAAAIRALAASEPKP